jgi:hypothetical protein
MAGIQEKTGNMKYFPILAIIIFFVGVSFAQNDIQLSASVSKNAVGLNEQFSYSLEVTGKSSSLPDVAYPDFKDFFVLSGPNQSTNIQWVNGKMSASKTNTFYLQPRKSGKITIPAATVSYKGKSFSSNSIVITVSNANKSAPQKSQIKNLKDSENR